MARDALGGASKAIFEVQLAMGNIDLLRVVLGAAAFFLVGMVWYGVLFGTIWKRAIGREPDANLVASLIPRTSNPVRART